MIVAGEASGDMYGARVVDEAHRLDSSVRFFGIGGPAMRKAGVETIIDSKEMAVMGFVEVLSHFGVIYRAFNTLKSILLKDKPNLLILIDYPGFNMRLAKVAKRRGVKVLYFITPQVWAWHSSRAGKIAKIVDHAAVILPFEVPIFEKVGLPVTFTGHPLLEMALPTMTRTEAFTSFALDPSKRIIGLFPGSRKREIKELLPVMLGSAEQLQSRFDDLQFVIPLAPGIDRSFIDEILKKSGINVKLIEGKNYDVIQVSDVIIAASGTVTMEIALFGVPMVIVYKMSRTTYAIGKHLVQVEYIGLCNIIAGESVVKELIQNDANSENITAEVSNILTNKDYAAEMRKKLLDVKKKLGEPGAASRVAALAISMIEEGDKN
ncbi:MAG: lipid-A-disaccharide synthase [Desulfuromonadales bacterium]|nr:lipid-A-disaccharide synthase [Desulfuromonadales bacterium]